MTLAESSWDILDVSDSDVSDYGISVVAKRFKCLRAADIRYRSQIDSFHPTQELILCKMEAYYVSQSIVIFQNNILFAAHCIKWHGLHLLGLVVK